VREWCRLTDLILVTGATGYVLYPIHGTVFNSMIDRLCRQASA
jgi:hypothetical protein